MLRALVLAAATSCADPAALDQQLDEILLKLRPGLTLDQVADITEMPREWLVPVRGELIVGVVAKAWNRVAGLQLECGYSAEKVGECKVSVARSHTEFIDPGRYQEIKVGQSIGAVLATLCRPERTEVAPDGSVTLSYSMEYPFEAYIPYGPTLLSFDPSGRLRQKVAEGR